MLQIFYKIILIFTFMNRKNFIASLGAIGIAPLQSLANISTTLPTENDAMPILKKGDTIGITCPAGYITLDDIKPGIQALENWGFKIKIGNTVNAKWNTFGGTDEERKTDLQNMLNDDGIKAIMCARGGYGCMRIIDDLNFTKFKKNPKWLIGFSDITALHYHLFTLGFPSIHSKMLNSFPKDPLLIDDTHKSVLNTLINKKNEYPVVVNPNNILGKCKGKLIGGNLSIVYNMVGTSSDVNTKGCILFLEDVSEQLYSVDRMLWNLRRSGKLKNLSGLIIGGFNRLKDDEKDPFILTITDMVLAVVKGYNFPVCFDFPVGHQKNNYALVCGQMHSLVVSDKEVVFKKI
jgi:muramoyltetrapeptide carboxypeptidase